MPKGRPSKYSPALAAEICERLADGKSLRAICCDKGMPNRATVRAWLFNADFAAFHAQYARARTEGMHALAENALQRAEMATNEDANAVRVYVDAVKWFASKVAPKDYGERITADHRLADGDGQPVDVLTAAQRIAFLLAMGVQQAEEKSPPLH